MAGKIQKRESKKQKKYQNKCRAAQDESDEDESSTNKSMAITPVMLKELIGIYSDINNMSEAFGCTV